MEKILQGELDYAYELIKTIFSIEFPKPKIYYGRKHIDKFRKIHSMKDFAWSPEMEYNHCIQGIYVPETISVCLINERICIFTHELGHAFVDNTSKELTEKNVKMLFEKKRFEEAAVYSTVHEGLADYFAIKSCLRSGNFSLEDEGKKRKQDLEKNFENWISSKDFKMLAYVESKLAGKPVPCLFEDFRHIDYCETLFRYFSKAPSLLSCYSYYIGHYFISNLKEFNLEKILNSPPKKIKTLIYPETY